MMFRRTLLAAPFGLLLGLFTPRSKADTPPKEKPDRFLIHFYINVLQLPPSKAMAFMDRVKQQLEATKQEGWTYIFTTFRSPAGRRHEIKVYALSPKGKWTDIPEHKKVLTAFEEIVELGPQFHQEFGTTEEQREERDRQTIVYVKHWFGAPVTQLPADFDNDIRYGIGLARQYQVPERMIPSFVCDILKPLSMHDDYPNFIAQERPPAEPFLSELRRLS